MIRKIFLIFSLLFLYQCCGSEEAIKNDENILNKSDYIKPMPRGMVELSLTIQEITEQNNKIFISSFIDTVHKYGAGVKPIAVGTFNLIEIDQNLFNSNKSEFEKGKQIKCRITSNAQSMDAGKANKLKIISLITER
jgi:hypothetical protein